MKFGRFLREILISERFSKIEVVFDGAKKPRDIRTTHGYFYYLYKSK